MPIEDLLCSAIAGRNLVRFYYIGNSVHGFRTVEPYTVGELKNGNSALSAWFIEGASESGERGWKLYSLAEISQAGILPTHFSDDRQGYVPGGGKLFRSARCTA